MFQVWRFVGATLVSAAMTLAVPAAADAHLLSEARAGRLAMKEARAFADDGEWYGWHSCNYRSVHARRCLIASYDESDDITCDAFVNVRFASRYSYRLRAGRWYAIECYEGDEYGFLDE
jgi:hypothetical protein